jgi:hypothetical protein
MATNVDKFLELSEVPGSVAVPVGGIIMWMNTGAAAMNPTPPGGFEFCDGTAVVTGGSPLLGEIKPNLMITSAGGTKGVARGADVNAAPYGVGTPLLTGGGDAHDHTMSSETFNHTHQMSSHTHSMQNHTHTGGSGGTHGHGFTGTSNQAGVPATGASYQGGAFFHNHSVGSGSSSHSHGATSGPSTASTAGPSSSNTGTESANHAHNVNPSPNIPFFTEVAFIVRVL